MIRIEFTGDDVVKLKNEVREFAITHLGLNFTNEAAKITSTAAGPMPVTTGHVAKVEIDDPPKKKPGREPGKWKKNPTTGKMEEVQETVAAQAPPPPPPVEIAAPISIDSETESTETPSQEQVNDVVRALVAKDNNSLDRAREFLARFKVSKAKELKEEQRAPFIQLVKHALGQ